MIDLTKISLEEVQNLVDGTADNREVKIYAVNGGGCFPIHGAVQQDGHWKAKVWRKDGFEEVGSGFNLKLKSKTIDFAQLPVDTLVSFKGSIMHLALATSYQGSVRLFRNGSNSLTTNGDSINVSCTEIKLVEGRKVVWEGGDCPLPDGVEVKVCYRKHSIPTYKRTANCIEFDWSSNNNAGDIIWYQITGRII